VKSSPTCSPSRHRSITHRAPEAGLPGAPAVVLVLGS
jgi:hypothetical protein